MLNMLLLLNLICFAARLKQTDLMNKTSFDNKLIRFDKAIISNKTKHLEVEKTRNSLAAKYYNSFYVRTYFTSNDESPNTFVYQRTPDVIANASSIVKYVI